MKTRLLLAAGVGTVGAAIAVSPAGSSIRDLVLPPQTAASQTARSLVPAAPVEVRLPPAADGTPAPDPTAGARLTAPPQLAVDTATAASVVRAPGVLQKLAAAAGVTIVSMTPWTNEGSDVVIGAQVEVTLDRPLTANVSLPGIRYDASGQSYERMSVKQRIEGATGFSVLVDFRTRSIVSVVPDAGATVTELPGNAHHDARGE